MPIVSTKKFFVPTELGDREEQRIKFCFNQRFGGFYVLLDNLWVAYLENEERRELGISYEGRYSIKQFMMIDDTFESLERRFGSFLDKATEKIQSIKREKVILIHFEVYTIKEMHGKDGSWAREMTANTKTWGWESHDHTQIRFNYKVGFRCGTVYFSENMSRFSDFSTKEAIIINWTKARQAFFAQVHNSFHEMIWRIDDFLNRVKEEPKALDEMIRQQIPLLSDGGHKKTNGE